MDEEGRAEEEKAEDDETQESGCKSTPAKYDPLMLTTTSRIKWEDAEQIRDTLVRMEGDHQWWIGDFLAISEKEFGEEYAQLIPEGECQDTWRKYKWVCERVKPSVRRLELSFTHHEKVAKLIPNDQRKWLKRAIVQKWSKTDLGKEIKLLTGGDDGGTDQTVQRQRHLRVSISYRIVFDDWGKEEDILKMSDEEIIALMNEDISKVVNDGEWKVHR